MESEGAFNLKSGFKVMAQHGLAYETRQGSNEERLYSYAMRDSITVLRNVIKQGSFVDVLRYEMYLAKQDSERYSRNESVQKNVLCGINDLTAGVSDYQLLRDKPEDYFKIKKKYVIREMAAPDKVVPIDSMRKALRGQVARVKSYASSPMTNDEEREFQKVRLSMIRHAEKLYDRFQREQKLLVEERGSPERGSGGEWLWTMKYFFNNSRAMIARR